MKDVRCRTKIPSSDFIFKDVEYDLKNEELVKLSNSKIIYAPMHLFNSVEGAIGECLLRESVIEKIKNAANSLPNGYYLKIYDAWRPFNLQEELYNRYRDDIDDMENIISLPIRDKLRGPAHTTGGSVDLTIVNENGIELNMGTKFGEYSEKSYTDYFELRYPENIEIIKNRRLLYHVMVDAGFSNMPTKWWHYDYGNLLWAYCTNRPVLYDCKIV